MTVGFNLSFPPCTGSWMLFLFESYISLWMWVVEGVHGWVRRQLTGVWIWFSDSILRALEVNSGRQGLGASNYLLSHFASSRIQFPSPSLHF